jgi:hypothetical protein
VKPTDVHAVVVGIEKYDIAPEWNLNGPALDAARFVRWLRDREVPAENIALFTSPLDENKSFLADLDVKQNSADHKTIMEAITGDIAKRNGELLFLMWGGHGVIGDSIRRLFFSDVAQNYLLNIEFEALLKFLRSTAMAGFSKQACFVDACANYFELMQSPAALANVPTGSGTPRLNISQFALFGAGAGERAKNLNAIQSGLFSSILLEELGRTPKATWPPDFEALRSNVQDRMLKLRAEGKARQTPAHYYYRNWGISEGTFQDVPARPAPGADREVTLVERDRLVEALLKCATMTNPARRNAIVGDLRPSIANDIERDPAARFDVMAIVKTCARFRGGLVELLHIVHMYEGESTAAAALFDVFGELRLSGV